MSKREGLAFLVGGYIEYAQEVIGERALPCIDGFKPSQRKILYVMKEIEKVGTELSKSANIVGATMKLNPHGDASIYETLVRLVESGQYLNIPYLKGKGAFGKVYSKDATPAASRYTEVGLQKLTEDILFRGLEYVEKVPSYDGKYVEPKLLPVSIPTILCNPQQGLAVGISTNIPAYNPIEVIKSVQKRIKGEDIGVIVPDYPTGGEILQDGVELERIMKTGEGVIRLQGKHRVEKKNIIITEIPYYTTIEAIIEAARRIPGVSEVRDETDRKGLRVVVEVEKLDNVERVEKLLLKKTPYRLNVTAKMYVILGGAPQIVGVSELIDKWLEFRKEVKKREIEGQLLQTRKEIAKQELMTVLVDRGLVTKLLQEDEEGAKKLVAEAVKELKLGKEEGDWVLDKRLFSLSKVKKDITTLREREVVLLQTIAEIDNYIYLELDEILRKNRKNWGRKTEIVKQDVLQGYVEEKVSKREEEIAEPAIIERDGLFIKRLKAGTKKEGIVKCQSTDIICLLDSKGRVIRIRVSALDIVLEREKGLYIPNYIGDDGDYTIKDMWLYGEESSKRKMFYADGYCVTVDNTEWIGKKIARVLEKGVAPKYITALVEGVEEKEVYLLYTKQGKLGIIDNAEIRVKSRLSRTPIIRVGKKDSIIRVESYTYEELSYTTLNIEKFRGKFQTLEEEDREYVVGVEEGEKGTNLVSEVQIERGTEDANKNKL